MMVPMGTRCLVEPVKVVSKSDAGILVDEAIIQAPQSIRVKVLAIGRDVKYIKSNDEVLVSQYGPTEAKETPFDKTLVVCEEDVLCVIKPDKASK